MEKVIKNFITINHYQYITAYLLNNVLKFDNSDYEKNTTGLIIRYVSYINTFELNFEKPSLIFESIPLPTIVYQLFMNNLKNLIEGKLNLEEPEEMIKDNKNYLLINKDVILNEKKDKLKYMFDYEIDKYHFMSNDIIDKRMNDNLFMENSIFYGLMYETEKEVVDKSLKFIKTVSTNNIKILSFISLSLCMYYCKMYMRTKDNLYKSSKWLIMITNYLMEMNYEGLNLKDKKKFMFMLIKYMGMEFINFDYKSLLQLNECYCTDINDTVMNKAGNTGDQIFLLSYYIIRNSLNWNHLKYHLLMMYHELKMVSVIVGWFYFMMKPNSKMYIYHKIIEKDGKKRDGGKRIKNEEIKMYSNFLEKIIYK